MSEPMHIMQSPPGPETVIDGRRYLYFAGTGYLGLQGDPEVIRAACEATQRYGLGSATTRAWFGNTPPTLDAERLAAEFLGAEASFYYASGYWGTQILLDALADSADVFFVDEHSHFSVQEAAQRSGKPAWQFAHRSADDLHSQLRTRLQAGQRPLVLSDGVFSVRGAIAPVREYRQVLMQFPGAGILLDDAHAVGVLGAHGRGTWEHAGLWAEGINAPAGRTPALYSCATASKALGGFGGIIAGSTEFVTRLKSTGHYYDGASAPPIPAAAATAKAIELLIHDPTRRARLRENVVRVKQGLRQLGLEVDDSPVPIVCLVLGASDTMRRLQRDLFERGIVVAFAGGYSGVREAGALRVAVFATHTEVMIQRLLDELAELL
jgi:8-amino-7-oxononanoate synthase